MEDQIFILLLGIPIFIGTVFLSIGIGIGMNVRNKKKCCTQPVMATVIKLVQRRTSSDVDIHDIATYSWFPVYQYEYNEKTYTRESSFGNSKKIYKEGQTLYLFINPKDPEKIYNSMDKQGLFAKIFIGIGIGLLAIGIIIFCLGKII